LTASDGAGTKSVAVISESMARTFWPGRNPIGRTFLFGGDGPPVEVIGVVADVREGGLELEPGPQMYLPFRANADADLAIVARGSGAPAGLLAGLTRAVREVDPAQPVYNVRTMDQVVDASIAARKANTLLISMFGALALLIAALGVYAVTANAVSQRMREFGIRAALGATRSDLFRHVGGEMVVVVGGGIVVGAGLAWAASRLMQDLLYAVDIHDLRTFTGAPIVLVTAAIVATLIPALRAVRVHPVEVMRAE
jgi:ABC-type antimicrobial peptide transport system permease subunit